MDYVEIIDIKEDSPDLLLEHKLILDQRLSKAEEGKTAYKNWDLLVKSMRTKPFSIEISDDAENDLDNSFSYYFKESPKVAQTFIKCIKTGLENVKKRPFSCPVIYKGLRKYTV